MTLQKLTERRGALKHKKFKKTSDMALWEKLMKVEFMSSEESDIDGEEDVFVIHDLPWRKPSVKRMFSSLDAESSKNKSSQAKRQMKRRVSAGSSSRPKPTSCPKWAVIDAK